MTASMVERPEGVRLVGLDVVVSVNDRLTDAGTNEEGMHEWLLPLTPEELQDVYEGTLRVEISMLPGRTTLLLRPSVVGEEPS